MILLITDGIPTRPGASPYDEAKEYALETSVQAKEDEDITIIGVFVDTGSRTSSYLQNLVTPGYYLEAEFDELNVSLLDSLMAGVECAEEEPTAMPSSMPSNAPSSFPSASPTSSPTCNPKDVSVCVAIDRSGSICSSECVSGQDCPTCTNWEAQIDFTGAFISSTRDWDGEQQFALVTFGNVGEVQTPLKDVDTALEVLSGIPYKRRWTNTMDGLDFCRAELANVPAGIEKLIILVTDGIPTRPLDPDDASDGYDYAKLKATESATTIKDEGTTLMTVAVGTSSYTSRYLASLATSEELAVTVDNFDELDAVSGRIAAQISCV